MNRLARDVLAACLDDHHALVVVAVEERVSPSLDRLAKDSRQMPAHTLLTCEKFMRLMVRN